MKMEIWPDDVGMPEMTDWLAELRDEGHAEAAADGPRGRAEADEASPEVSVPAQADGAVSSDDGAVSSDQAGSRAKTSSPGQTWPASETGATGWDSLPAETGAMDRMWSSGETDPPGQSWPPAATRPPGRIRARAKAG